MFVRSLMNKDVVYRKGGNSWVIKAGTVTAIDENRVSAKDLKSLYGSRIIVISRDAEEDKVVEPIVKRQEKLIKEVKVKTVTPVTKILDETLIDNIIAQIETEESKNKNTESCENGKCAFPCDDCNTKKLEEEKVKLDLENKKLEEEKAKLAELEKTKAEEAKKLEEEKAKLVELEKAKAQAKVAPKTKDKVTLKKTSRRGRKAKNK